jgi:hypothetical protein
MNRKEFLAGFSVAAATIVLARDIGWAGEQPAKDANKTGTSSKETPLDKKYDFAQTYIKRLMDVMDAELTPEQRSALLEANGRECFRQAKYPKFPGTLDDFIKMVSEKEGPDVIRREDNTIHFRYVQNPRGLRTDDGYCLCPLVEKGPPDLSGTFCECSVGYVREMFSQMADKPVKVELTESVKRGGKACRFVIHV